MKTKPDIKKMIQSIKKSVAAPVDMKKELNETLVHPAFREKDMRQEAMDMGSHGAKELWGEPNGPV